MGNLPATLCRDGGSVTAVSAAAPASGSVGTQVQIVGFVFNTIAVPLAATTPSRPSTTVAAGGDADLLESPKV